MQRGYVLTNHHVIRCRRRSRDAEGPAAAQGQIVGGDPGTDIAVLKIEADNLNALPLATPTRSRWAISCWRSATRSASVRR